MNYIHIQDGYDDLEIIDVFNPDGTLNSHGLHNKLK